MTTRRSSRRSLPTRPRRPSRAWRPSRTAGDVFDTVEPGKSKLSYQVLFDPDGEPETAVVSVIFRATAEGKDGTYLAIVSEGEYFLSQIDGQEEGWKITAFDVTRDDHETQPPSPSASASPSA
jgi:hypothetical protein